MKQTFIYVLIATVAISCSSCKKDVSPTDDNGLPAATQDGKNTLGFLLNGQPWIPKGSRVTSNLSIDYDAGYNNGIFNIVAYNFIPTISEQFTIAIKDSLNYMQAPISFLLTKSSLFGISFDKNCPLFSTYSDVNSSGNFTLTKFDKVNRIIAGTFNATLSKQGCDTIKITEGRFDMKF